MRPVNGVEVVRAAAIPHAVCIGAPRRAPSPLRIGHTTILRSISPPANGKATPTCPAVRRVTGNVVYSCSPTRPLPPSRIQSRSQSPLVSRSPLPSRPSSPLPASGIVSAQPVNVLKVQAPQVTALCAPRGLLSRHASDTTAIKAQPAAPAAQREASANAVRTSPTGACVRQSSTGILRQTSTHRVNTVSPVRYCSPLQSRATVVTPSGPSCSSPVCPSRSSAAQSIACPLAPSVVIEGIITPSSGGVRSVASSVVVEQGILRRSSSTSLVRAPPAASCFDPSIGTAACSQLAAGSVPTPIPLFREPRIVPGRHSTPATMGQTPSPQRVRTFLTGGSASEFLPPRDQGRGRSGSPSAHQSGLPALPKSRVICRSQSPSHTAAGEFTLAPPQTAPTLRHFLPQEKRAPKRIEVPLETVSTSQTSAQSEDAFDFDGDRSEVLGRAYIDESDKEAGLFHQGQRPKELAARHLEAAQEVIEKMCMRENVAQFQSQVTSEDVNSTQLWDVMANSVLRPPKSSKASLGRRSFPPPVVPSHERVFAGPLHAAASASGCKPCSNSKEGPVTANGVKKTQTVSAFVDELSKLLPHRQSGFFANSPREDSDDLLRELRLGADLPRTPELEEKY